jgi:Fe-S cluster biogenesis protein NfuA
MHAERTPNPHSVKWVVSRPVVPAPGSASFLEAPAIEESPLAARLFGVPGVSGVFLGPDFVTVSKAEDREWTELAPAIVAEIKAWATADEAALGPAWRPADPAEGGEVVRRIREILELEIRPYVVQDGGEIAFAGFEAGVVQVHLRGACAGCPSSTVTLKMGIEARLKQELPEVEAVVAL